MNKLIVILCITGLISNVYFGLFSSEEQTWTEVFSDSEDDEEPEPSHIISVIIPERRVKEIARYDNEMFMEMYWENKTSGNWTKYTLTVQGQIHITSSIIEKEDGFGDVHSTVCTNTITSGTFELIVEENDGEPVVVPGSYNAKRWEYMDLNEKVVIQIVTDGEVSTEAALAYTNVPLTFDGKMRSYPNPNMPRVETLDEKIYGNNKEIKLGDQGNITKTVDTEWNWTGYTYHWIANSSEKVSGYDTIRIDVNTTFFEDWLPFNEKIWISSETPYPVKMWTRTNESEDDENYTFYMIVETTRIMRNRGYASGTNSIPWGTTETNFKQKNPDGEYKSWYSNYMPISGKDFNESSFDFKQEDAVDYAIQHSSGLKSFMNKYDDVVVSSAVYTAEQDIVDSHAGTYWWNLTFGHNPSREEYENNDHWKYSYNIKVECDIEKHLIGGGYDETVSRAEELGLVNGSSPRDKSELNPYMLTLTSSENLLKQDEEVQENAVDIRGEIDFDEDTTYSFGVGGISIETLPGLDIIGTLTGISFPEFESGWILQKGTIWENGETFSAGVDAETGQLLYVTHIEGTVLSIAF